VVVAGPPLACPVWIASRKLQKAARVRTVNAILVFVTLIVC
jgi:hypothetical protein